MSDPAARGPARALRRAARRDAATRLDLAELCQGREPLLPAVRALVERYEGLQRSAAPGGRRARRRGAPRPELPSFPGFRTLERLGRGGGGDVYKLEDLTLGRVVAAKVLRPDSPLPATVADFLREARALALFDDPRIVRLLEYRPGEPPVLLMEHVDGFALDEIGRLARVPASARGILADVAERPRPRPRASASSTATSSPATSWSTRGCSRRSWTSASARGEPDRGHGVGTPRLHGAGAARPAAADRRAQRRLRARRDPLRAALRRAAVRGRERRGADRAIRAGDRAAVRGRARECRSRCRPSRSRP